MTVTQTINIPVDRRLTIDIPREMPIGPTILTFTPIDAGGGCLKRKIGTLEGKMSVVFSDDFVMTDEELINV